MDGIRDRLTMTSAVPLTPRKGNGDEINLKIILSFQACHTNGTYNLKYPSPGILQARDGYKRCRRNASSKSRALHLRTQSIRSSQISTTKRTSCTVGGSTSPKEREVRFQRKRDTSPARSQIRSASSYRPSFTR
jgi:hypothetical protein